MEEEPTVKNEDANSTEVVYLQMQLQHFIYNCTETLRDSLLRLESIKFRGTEVGSLLGPYERLTASISRVLTNVESEQNKLLQIGTKIEDLIATSKRSPKKKYNLSLKQEKNPVFTQDDIVENSKTFLGSTLSKELVANKNECVTPDSRESGSYSFDIYEFLLRKDTDTEWSGNDIFNYVLKKDSPGNVIDENVVVKDDVSSDATDINRFNEGSVASDETLKLDLSIFKEKNTKETDGNKNLGDGPTDGDLSSPKSTIINFQHSQYDDIANLKDFDDVFDNQSVLPEEPPTQKLNIETLPNVHGTNGEKVIENGEEREVLSESLLSYLSLVPTSSLKNKDEPEDYKKKLRKKPDDTKQISYILDSIPDLISDDDSNGSLTLSFLSCSESGDKQEVFNGLMNDDSNLSILYYEEELPDSATCEEYIHEENIESNDLDQLSPYQNVKFGIDNALEIINNQPQVIIDAKERLLAEEYTCSPRNTDKNKVDEFNRLVNLDNVNNKRKRVSDEDRKRKSKRRKKGPINLESDGTSSSSSDETTISQLSKNSFEELLEDMSKTGMSPDKTAGKEKDMNSEVLDLCLSDSDELHNTISSSEDSDKKEKKKLEAEGKDGDKPKSEKVKKMLSKEEASKKKWRRDKLLTGKLSSGESSSDTEVDETSILPGKYRKQIELKKLLKQPTPTNTDSDFEPRKASTSKKRIRVKSSSTSSDSKETDHSIFEISDNDSGHNSDKQDTKKGRKNIKAVIKDKDLTLSTRIAKQEEEQRTMRLSEKHRAMTCVLSQSQESRFVLDVDEISNTVLVSVHRNIEHRLKPHQKEGVRFMWDSCYESIERIKVHSGAGCILAHCMGLGKTFQVVALIHTLFAHPETKTKYVLVICPLSTVLNWQNEFKIGLENVPHNIKIYLITEQQKDKLHRLYVIENWHKTGGVLVMGYDAYISLVKAPSKNCNKRVNHKKIMEALVKPGPDLVVCDEGHLLKNGKNIRTQALMQIQTKRRIILTGTPLQNNMTEYFHMVKFVKPNLLGSFVEYKNRFANPIHNGQWHNSTESDIKLMKKRTHVLSKLLKTTVQRFEVSELKTYLPEKVDYVLFVKLNKVQATLYKKYFSFIELGGVIKGNKLFSDFHNMQPLWTHPFILQLKEKSKNTAPPVENDTIDLDPEVREVDGIDLNWWKQDVPCDYDRNVVYGSKMSVTLNIIDECEKLGDKVLLFSSSLLELDAVEHFLKIHGTSTCSNWEPGKDYYRMDGTVLPDKRHSLCNQFNNVTNKRTRLFLISTKVGGLGLNLVAANRVILLDVSWNPSYDSQSIFRVYRFGQTKEVFVYRIVSKGTMEEVVYERSVTKQAIANRVVDEMQISRHFNSNDVEQMYRCEVDDLIDQPILKVPQDQVLANIIISNPAIIGYVEHQSLLENLANEELNEEEMKIAWDEYNCEKDKAEMMQRALLPISNFVNQNVNPGRSNVDSHWNFTAAQIRPLNLNPAIVNQTETIDVDSRPEATERNTTQGMAQNLKFPSNCTLNQLTRLFISSEIKSDYFGKVVINFLLSKGARCKFVDLYPHAGQKGIEVWLNKKLVIKGAKQYSEEVYLIDLYHAMQQDKAKFMELIENININESNVTKQNGTTSGVQNRHNGVVDIVDLDESDTEVLLLPDSPISNHTSEAEEVVENNQAEQPLVNGKTKSPLAANKTIDVIDIERLELMKDLSNLQEISVSEKDFNGHLSQKSSQATDVIELD